VTDPRPAYYAPTGTRIGELTALLHPPYTMWHLSYVAMGAGLAPSLDTRRLVGTLMAFVFGLGLAAHAFDEVNDRPLGTHFSDRALWLMGWGGMAAAGAVSAWGAVIISPWVVGWALGGILLAVGYGLEWFTMLHSDAGFAAAWGAFPLLAGYWAQAESLSPAAVAAAIGAALIAWAQRGLSTPARFVRRETTRAEVGFDGAPSWSREYLLATWERALRALSWAMAALAIAMVVRAR